jgi:ABC-2 type transport system permease protein
VRAAAAIFRRALVDGKVVTASFAVVFAAMGFANAVGYRRTYPTTRERLELARTFGLNKAVQLFYGRPHDLLTVGGYAGWRLGGFGSIVASAWAVFAVVRVLRAEEDQGRQDLVLANPVSRRHAYAAALAAVAVAAAILWLVALLALVAARLPVGGSAYLTLVTISPAAVFAGVGAAASQIGATRRVSLQLSLGVLGVAYLLRVVADIAGGAGAVRWATPLGWVEELRPFARPNPAPLLLLGLVAAVLLVVAGSIVTRRDIGNGLLPAHDTAAPRVGLLRGPGTEALRAERGSLAAWALGIGTFAVTVGVLSTAFSKANISTALEHELRKLGGTSIVTPAGALGFYFVFFVLLLSLFACSQVASARREEADQRLELLLALPIGRARWLGGRVALATLATAGLAVIAGVLAWIGAAIEHAGVSLPRLVGAGANTLPAALCFLGLGLLAYGLAPRASVGIAYGLVVGAFLLQLFGALVGAPGWVLDLSPFSHVAAVPGAPFRVGAAAVMVAVGLGAAALAFASFARRDLFAN